MLGTWLAFILIRTKQNPFPPQLSLTMLCGNISMTHNRGKTKAEEWGGLSKATTIIPEQLSARLMAYVINLWWLGEDGLCVAFFLPVTFLFPVAVTLRV